MTDSSLISEPSSPQTEEGEIMTEPTHIKNIFEPQAANPLASVLPYMGGMGGMGGAGAGAGAGLGAGLLGGILGGALLGNRGGLLGGGNGDNVGGVVTPALLASSLAQVTDTAQNTTVLQTLGDIKASIPLAEGQVQLALAGAQADLNRSISTGLQVAVQGQALINKNIGDAIASSLASQNSINVNVLTQGAATREAVTAFGTANLTATKDAQYATGIAIANSTKEIIAALTEQNTQTLQRQLAVAEGALIEQRAVGRSREVEVNVSQTVNQNQAQLQMQQQQQQQFQILANLNAVVGNLVGDIQAIRTTQSNVNFGVQGTAGQTASAANTRVN